MIPVDAVIQDWMDRLSGHDFSALRLKYAGNDSAMAAIMQLECRKKAAGKLPTYLGYNGFTFPTTLSAEQCTSEPLARFHASLIPPGGKLLDMTCGLGIDAFHLSKTAREITAVDLNPDVAEAASHNARVLGIDNITVVCADSVEYIRQLKTDSYSAIFIDPARRSQGNKVVLLSDCSPDVTSLLPQMLEVAKTVIIKASPMLDITASLNALSCVADIYAIGTPTECKELTFVCRRGYDGSPSLHAATILGESTDIFNYSSAVTISARGVEQLHENDWLLEPFPAVMKCGRYDELAERCAVKKLSNDTHIFTSPHCPDNFPGKKMEIIWTSPYNKRAVKYIKENFPKANITTRGFPLSAPQLAKTLSIPQGGETIIYGVGLDGRRNYWIAVCRAI